MRLSASLYIPLVLAAALFAGCKATTPGKLSAVQPVSNAPRAGNAYLLRGFIGVFSEGIDGISGKLNDSGVRSHVYQDAQWSELADTIRDKYRAEKNHEPIVLIGHSYGADDVIRIARKLHEAQIEVALLVTIDPVTPPKIPANVTTCLNLYQSNGAMDKLPWLRGMPVEPDQPGPSRLVNSDIRKDRTDLLEPGVDHFNIEKKPKVQSEVLKQVLATCPPRSQWVAQAAIRNLAMTTAANIVPVSLDQKPAPAHPIQVSDGGGDVKEPD